MNILEKINYILTVEMVDCSQSGITAIVDKPEGTRELNDSNEDYFDHKYIDQSCEEDFCYGHEYIPVDDGSSKYFKVQFYC